jgi:hypothetical protein
LKKFDIFFGLDYTLINQYDNHKKQFKKAALIADFLLSVGRLEGGFFCPDFDLLKSRISSESEGLSNSERMTL